MASACLLPHCSVCKNLLRYDGPQPYLLPCLHSICSDCLSVDCDTVSCSKCRDSFSKRDYIFLKDTITEAEIFASNVKDNPSKIKCTKKTHKNEAVVWCKKCQLFFCKVCQISHKQEKSSHQSEVVWLKNLSSVDTLVQTSYCPQHETCVLDLHDSTCEILICSKCAASEHNQCKVIPVDEASAAEDKELLHAEKKKLGRKLQEVISTLEGFHNMQKDLDSRNTDVRRVVAHCFDSLRALVTKREQELLKELETRNIASKDNIEQANKHLERTAEKIQVVHDYTGKMLRQGHTGDVLVFKNTVRSRLVQCLSEKVETVGSGGVMVAFSKTKLDDVKKLVSTLGDIDFIEGDAGVTRTMYENVDIGSDTMQPKLKEKPKRPGRHIDSINGNGIKRHEPPATHKYTETVPKCPEMLFDIEKININKTHINNDRLLVNSKLPLEKTLTQYVGTTAVTPLSDSGSTYWEVETDVQIDQLMQKFGILMEIGVMLGDDTDKQYCASGQPNARCLSIAHCATHKKVCAKIWNRGIKVRCIEDVLFNKAGESITLKHGVLFNGKSSSLAFYDLGKMEKIELMGGEEDDQGKEVWPLFGVYNSSLATVKMRLISGKYIMLPDEKLSNLI